MFLSGEVALGRILRFKILHAFLGHIEISTVYTLTSVDFAVHLDV